MSTQSLDSDIYDYGFILNSTALHEAAMSVLVTTIYGRWRGTTTLGSLGLAKWEVPPRESYAMDESFSPLEAPQTIYF